MKIFYITRTLPNQNNGGSIIRNGSINNLISKGYEVIVIAPNYINNLIIHTDSQILIPIKHCTKILSWAEHFGLIEDYLQPWAKKVFLYLRNIITSDDLVFCTSGGELGTIIIGYYLKEKIGCKFLINFHDPLGYTTILGKLFKISTKFHVSRDKAEKKYLATVDAIITSTKFYANALSTKYPNLKEKIYYNYFGYIEKSNTLSQKKLNHNITIAYGGIMGHLQAPEILAYAAKDIPNLKIIFIGNISYFKNFDFSGINVELYESMPREQFLYFLANNVDIGFLSLKGDVSDFCVPSKLYDYINLGLPVLAAIGGDSIDIINKNGYGLACNYNINDLRDCLLKYAENPELIIKYKNNVLKDRNNWYMGELINDLCNIIEELK